MKRFSPRIGSLAPSRPAVESAANHPLTGGDRSAVWSAITGLCLFSAMATGSPAFAGGSEFDRSVLPVLVSRCLECHSGEEPRGGLDLTRKKSASKAIVVGKAADSELWKRVNSGEMPPKKPLPESEKAVLKAWIESGATWGTDPIDPFSVTTATRAGRDWWSLQPLARPKAPLTGNPIDVFIRKKLAEAGMKPAPPADRRTLIRRVHFDLLGLPPKHEQVEDFVNDERPDAYERLIDSLLASPHHGERWGRYWLDTVRYAETCGYERDQVKPDVWKYRDWVISAINNDMPFSRFVTEQLAGDELDSSLGLVRYIAWAIPAIGFIGTVRGIGDALSFAEQAIQGDISAVTTWLGLAFNSTFVGLALCIILMFVLHVVQGRQEAFVIETQTFCRDRLIDNMKVPAKENPV